MSEIIGKFPIQSYIEEHRDKLDESMVSLRLMKEVDKFLGCKSLTNKDMALQLGYSESYVSQLMSGVKKFNTSFINKFEKSYHVEFDFKIYFPGNEEPRHRLYERKDFHITVTFNNTINIDSQFHCSFKRNSHSMSDISDIQFENL